MTGSWTSRWPSADPDHDRQLDEQMAQRPEHDADRQARHAERWHEQECADDDRDVVDDGGQGGGPEPALGVEDARRDRTRGQEQRREDHDPGQLDRLGQLRLVEPGRDDRHQDRCEHEDEQREDRERAEHQRRHRGDDAPRVGVLVLREQPGDNRDHRRRQRPGRHELEQEVGDAERGEERVEL
jgi:hypothetical protein